jgi:hypothetical protein
MAVQLLVAAEYSGSTSSSLLSLASGALLLLGSLYGIVNVTSCYSLLDAIYTKDRDKSDDPAKVRRIRIGAGLTFVFALYFLWRVIHS